MPTHLAGKLYQRPVERAAVNPLHGSETPHVCSLAGTAQATAAIGCAVLHLLDASPAVARR